MITFKDIYQGKKVLVTGNTGFKGSWMSIWLLSLGAKVYGISKDIPTIPSNFEVTKLNNKIKHFQQDIRDFKKVYKIIEEIQPDFVFHLAAQPIVKESFKYPLLTIETNVLGTANILDSLRKLNNKCTAVIITSDKCYDNKEWIWGYREVDSLGGEDPYSASKGAAELIIKTYALSFFQNVNSNTKIASVRAGNVIGGGDWANYRIVPDAIRAWKDKKVLKIRNPNSTRPWQHVLEPLSGYLILGQKLFENPALNGEAFNFGPNANQNFTVEELLKEMSKHWLNAEWEKEKNYDLNVEAGLLKLNCDKALHQLGWQPALNFQETIKMVTDWYGEFYNSKHTNLDMYKYTLKQINDYTRIGKERNITWAQT